MEKRGEKKRTIRGEETEIWKEGGREKCRTKTGGEKSGRRRVNEDKERGEETDRKGGQNEKKESRKTDWGHKLG